MINNDILRRVRYALDLSDPQLLKIVLEGQAMPRRAGASSSVATKAGSQSGSVGVVNADRLSAWLKKENEDGFEECPDLALNAFLDGLIKHQRGPSDRPPPPEPESLNNNLVLKKLRIAFALRSGQVVADIQRGGGSLSESELGAFARAPGHKKFKLCGDQMLRRFLQGVVLRMRGDPSGMSPSSSDSEKPSVDAKPGLYGNGRSHGKNKAAEKSVKTEKPEKPSVWGNKRTSRK